MKQASLLHASTAGRVFSTPQRHSGYAQIMRYHVSYVDWKQARSTSSSGRKRINERQIRNLVNFGPDPAGRRPPGSKRSLAPTILPSSPGSALDRGLATSGFYQTYLLHSTRIDRPPLTGPREARADSFACSRTFVPELVKYCARWTQLEGLAARQ